MLEWVHSVINVINAYHYLGMVPAMVELLPERL